MDSNQKSNYKNVDDILNELKGGSTPSPVGSVDDILAEMRQQKSSPSAAASSRPTPHSPVPSAPTSPTPDISAPASSRQPDVSPVSITPSAEHTFISSDSVPAPKKARRKSDSDAPIWDIQPEHEHIGPRMGKAAAMEKVQVDKYVNDTELNRWFGKSDNNSPYTDKREEKRLAKEEKRRIAQLRKEEKRLAKKNKNNQAEYTDVTDPFSDTADDSSAFSVSDVTVDEAFFNSPLHEKYAPPAGAPTINIAQKKDSLRKKPITVSKTTSSQTEEFSAAMGAAKKPSSQTEEFSAAMGAAKKPSSQTEEFSAAMGAAKKPSSQTEEFSAAMGASKMPSFQTEEFSTSTHTQSNVNPISLTLAFDIVPSDGSDGSETWEPKRSAASPNPMPSTQKPDTRSFDITSEETSKIPTATYTKEFAPTNPSIADDRSLYLDDMVDDNFRKFFSETATEEPKEPDNATRFIRRKKKKYSTTLLTGEFGQFAELMEVSDTQDDLTDTLSDQAIDDEFEDYARPQDAEAVEGDIAALCKSLLYRAISSGVITAILFWMSLSFASFLPLPEFMSFTQNPIVFSSVYLALLVAVIIVNFSTFTTGLIGLFSIPTADSAPSLACLAGLLQSVALLVSSITGTLASGTLFGFFVALILCFNAIGKRIRAVSILNNFKLASAGGDHSAAYILGGSTELTYNITDGLEEEDPSLLVSRPTTLVKGFLRQSFSQRNTDSVGRIFGWIVLGCGIVAAVLTYVFTTPDIFSCLSAFTIAVCLTAPITSSLVSGIPSMQLQKATSRLGTVIPGWSAIEELGQVNVVMAGARDIFPSSSVYLKSIKTFEKERIDLAILYAASVLVEGSDTLKDIFMGVIQGKQDMLYKVESLTKEPGRGFTAWVQNQRIVIGNREILQRHDVTPPPIELEMKFVQEGHMPVYLAVGGKLFALFIIGYSADAEVELTLKGLVQSGVSLLITNGELNISNEMIEHAYNLPPGVVKVLGRKELDILDPLTSYISESEGVMTHVGTFSSFIGGLRAAAACASAEKMSNIVQGASVVLAAVLCLVMAFGGNLFSLAWYIPLLYQIAWTLPVCALPILRKY